MRIPTIKAARRLKYYDVVNDYGEDLGQVQEFMLDMAQGRVAFVVVAFGGCPRPDRQMVCTSVGTPGVVRRT